MNQVHRLLEQVAATVSVADRVAADPVRFPRRLLEAGRGKEEIEAGALFAALLAYGAVGQFGRVIETVFTGCEGKFLELAQGQRDLPRWPAYRLNPAGDLRALVRAIGAVTTRHRSLEACFAIGTRDRPADPLRGGLATLRGALLNEMHAEAGASGLSPRHGHLLPDPDGNSCCKRWLLFLRWMVRPADGVDLGLWTALKPADLVIPLDRHISRLARSLGLTRRRSDSWATACGITAALRDFDRDDPVRFDFALCHLGISGACRHRHDPGICPPCPLRPVCLVGRKPGT